MPLTFSFLSQGWQAVVFWNGKIVSCAEDTCQAFLCVLQQQINPDWLSAFSSLNQKGTTAHKLWQLGRNVSRWLHATTWTLGIRTFNEGFYTVPKSSLWTCGKLALCFKEKCPLQITIFLNKFSLQVYDTVPHQTEDLLFARCESFLSVLSLTLNTMLRNVTCTLPNCTAV